jgi:hypothetical protein
MLTSNPTAMASLVFMCPIFGYDSPDKSEDDCVFDAFARDNSKGGEDVRPIKQQELTALSYRHPSPKSTISELKET